MTVSKKSPYLPSFFFGLLWPRILREKTGCQALFDGFPGFGLICPWLHAGHYEWHVAFPEPDIDMSAVRARIDGDGVLVIDVPRRRRWRIVHSTCAGDLRSEGHVQEHLL
jgi:hypothetical protein